MRCRVRARGVRAGGVGTLERWCSWSPRCCSLPVVELAVMIQVGSWIGGWEMLALLVMVTFLGVWIVKQQGVGAWSRIRRELAEGRVPGSDHRRRRADPRRGRAVRDPGLRHRRGRGAAPAPAGALGVPGGAEPPLPGRRGPAHRRRPAIVPAVGALDVGSTCDTARRPPRRRHARARRRSSRRAAAAPLRRRGAAPARSGASTSRFTCSGRSSPVGPATRSACCTSMSSSPWSSRSPSLVSIASKSRGGEHPAHPGHEPHDRRRAGEVVEHPRVPSATSACVGLAPTISTSTCDGVERGGLRHLHRRGRRLAAGEAPVPTVVAHAAHDQHVEVGAVGERLGGELGPPEHRDRTLGRERQHAGQATRCAVVAHQALGLPRGVRRVGRRQHAGAQPPEQRRGGVVVEEPAARHHDARPGRRRRRPGSRPPRPRACGRRRRSGRCDGAVRTAARPARYRADRIRLARESARRAGP